MTSICSSVEQPLMKRGDSTFNLLTAARKQRRKELISPHSVFRPQRYAIELPNHMRPELIDYIVFPFRMFTLDVWLCLGALIMLLYVAARAPQLYLKLFSHPVMV